MGLRQVIGISIAKLAGWLQVRIWGIHEDPPQSGGREPWRSAMHWLRSKPTWGTQPIPPHLPAVLRWNRRQHDQRSCATVQKPWDLSASATLVGSRAQDHHPNLSADMPPGGMKFPSPWVKVFFRLAVWAVWTWITVDPSRRSLCFPSGKPQAGISVQGKSFEDTRAQGSDPKKVVAKI